MFEKVLFPTDFSEYAEKTLDCISEIPGTKEVVLLHVVDATHPSKRGLAQGPHIETANKEKVSLVVMGAHPTDFSEPAGDCFCKKKH
jgi:nucleotide-binding universal stress UspA family protein